MPQLEQKDWLYSPISGLVLAPGKLDWSQITPIIRPNHAPSFCGLMLWFCSFYRSRFQVSHFCFLVKRWHTDPFRLWCHTYPKLTSCQIIYFTRWRSSCFQIIIWTSNTPCFCENSSTYYLWWVGSVIIHLRNHCVLFCIFIQCVPSQQQGQWTLILFKLWWSAHFPLHYQLIVNIISRLAAPVNVTIPPPCCALYIVVILYNVASLGELQSRL